MDSKGITKLHKQVEELHTESRVASGSERRETKCAIPPRVCVIVLFLSNPCCSYIIFLPYFQANRSHGHFVFNTFFQNFSSSSSTSEYIKSIELLLFSVGIFMAQIAQPST